MRNIAPELYEYGTQIRDAINSLNTSLSALAAKQSIASSSAVSLQSVITATATGVAVASAVLSADVNVTANTPAALSTAAVSLTMPSTGGPFRILTFGAVTYVATTQSLWKAWIQDGTNTWNGKSAGINAANLTDQSIDLGNLSPVTYGQGATVTLTPYAESNGSYSPGVKATDNFGGAATWFVAMAIRSS